MTTPYERSSRHSNDKIGEIRDKLQPIEEGNLLVLTCGSYARREASDESDIDYFIVWNHKSETQSLVERVCKEISEVVPIAPAPDGAFAQSVERAEMLECIGGDDDSNRNITRRILFMLEGEWLYNAVEFRSFRREILDRYIQEGMADHHLALFLLNDVIRYYRTVAVDYEYKTSGSGGKPWAIRNIKLVFSRKLLYASGLFSIARTVDRTRQEKIRTLEHLFGLPVVDRMVEICGEAEMRPVLNSYNRFLSVLEDVTLRELFEELPGDARSNAKFREIKNEGHRFTRELLRLFENTFHSTHPIWRAVLF